MDLLQAVSMATIFRKIDNIKCFAQRKKKKSIAGTERDSNER